MYVLLQGDQDRFFSGVFFLLTWIPNGYQDVGGDDKGDAHTYREDSWRSGGEAQERQADAKMAALRCVFVSACLCLCLCLCLCVS